MRYSPEYCIDVPDDFPADELAAFRAAARRVLLQPSKGAEWAEFAGASNLIGWRYRGSDEDWVQYKLSWQTFGAAVSHEEIYRREKALFGMFSAGVACVESCVYAIAALASHANTLAIRFDADRQRVCSPKRLLTWVEQTSGGVRLAEELARLSSSSEWRLWVDLRNRMTHRSNLPRITFLAAAGSELPTVRALHFAETTSTPEVEGDLVLFDALHQWLAHSIKKLLIEGTSICPR